MRHDGNISREHEVPNQDLGIATVTILVLVCELGVALR